MGSKCFYGSPITEPAQIIKEKTSRDELLSTQRKNKRNSTSAQLEIIQEEKPISNKSTNSIKEINNISSPKNLKKI